MLVGQNDKVQTDQWKIAPHVVELESSIIREILKISSQPGVISFAGGLPAPELFPMRDLQEAMEQIVKKHGAPAFQYTFSRGVPALHELLAQRATESGTVADADNILVINDEVEAYKGPWGVSDFKRT